MMIHVLTRWRLALSLIGAAMAASVGLMLSDVSPARSAGSVAPQTGPPQAPAAATSNYLQSYGVLERAPLAQDNLPGDPGDGVITASRLVSGPSGAVPEWIATTSSGQLCEITSDQPFGSSALPSACVSAAVLAADGELLVGGAAAYPNGLPGATPQAGDGKAALEGNSPPEIVAGAAPDGISTVTVHFADGSTETATVHDNGFEVTTHGSIPSGFTWTTAGGKDHVQGDAS
jgi:hypothetical protein